MKSSPISAATCLVLLAILAVVPAPSYGDVLLDLNWEFDGDSDGSTSFGTIQLSQNGSGVDFAIVANTANLMGGDINELYFNLPDAVNINTLMLSNSGGVSNQAINPFSLLGPNPSVTGGAGASFDTGINFGNGGGPPGNGLLTTATFSLTAMGGLLVSDLVSGKSQSNNVPGVFMAVHFQSADVFGNGSETVGGVPEPGCFGLLSVFGLVLLRNRTRRV